LSPFSLARSQGADLRLEGELKACAAPGNAFLRIIRPLTHLIFLICAYAFVLFDALNCSVKARALGQRAARRRQVVPTAGDYFMRSVPTEIGPKKSPSCVSSGCQTSCILSAESVSNSGLFGLLKILCDRHSRWLI
jgi:hypothetical protein